jgi:hypothetical protein
MRGAIEFCRGGSRRRRRQDAAIEVAGAASGGERGGHNNPTHENTEKCRNLFQALDRQCLNSGNVFMSTD